MNGLTSGGGSVNVLHAAEAGNIDAMLTLADVRTMGGDIAQAEALLERIADTGDSRGMHRLSVLLRRDGRLDEAEQWYVRAADQARHSSW